MLLVVVVVVAGAGAGSGAGVGSGGGTGIPATWKVGVRSVRSLVTAVSVFPLVNLAAPQVFPVVGTLI